MKPRSKLAIALGAGAAVALAAASPANAVKRGGVLNIVVGSKIPSYDGHRETTFGMIHPIRPFYSLLIRVNPDNPQSTSDNRRNRAHRASPTVWPFEWSFADGAA